MIEFLNRFCFIIIIFLLSSKSFIVSSLKIGGHSQIVSQCRQFNPSWIKSSSEPLRFKNNIKLQLSDFPEFEETSSGDLLAVGLAGTISNVVVAYSLYTLKTTGCGLPPGPFGLVGLFEGISYLVIIAIAGWSLKTKISTGRGLPAGPSGLLGAAEGLSYLSILVGLVIGGLNYVELGFLPGFVPDDKCYGS